jgi:hypothetical protein
LERREWLRHPRIQQARRAPDAATALFKRMFCQASLDLAQRLPQFVASNYDQLSDTSWFDIGE